MLTGKIDVTKIEKARLFKGEKGTYLDIVLIETPQSQYGDYMIVQSVTKEEREAGKRGAILGNAKVLGQRNAPPAQQPRQTPLPAAKPAGQGSDDESVPF